jgi:hypothetical protein
MQGAVVIAGFRQPLSAALMPTDDLRRAPQ